VSVLPGNGDGTFAPKTEYADANARSVAVGDFNEDGRPDLATANNTATNDNRPNGMVSVLLNTTPARAPQGGSTPPTPPAAPPPPAAGLVPGLGAVRDTSAPGVSNYEITNNPFVVGGGSTSTFGLAARAKKHNKGTTFGYTLSEAATVRIVIAQAASGRRRGRHCVAPTRRLRKARTCVRLSTRGGTLTRTSHQGANRVAFSGRIGSRKLAPGRYQATITATDAAKNTSKPQTISFTIVKR